MSKVWEASVIVVARKFLNLVIDVMPKRVSAPRRQLHAGFALIAGFSNRACIETRHLERARPRL